MFQIKILLQFKNSTFDSYSCGTYFDFLRRSLSLERDFHVCFTDYLIVLRLCIYFHDQHNLKY
jgi:hypothetical protein